MKKILFSVITLAAMDAPVKAQVALPVKYDSTVKVNYIRVWEPVKPYTDDASVISGSRTVQEVRQTTQYFDGLGRPIQSVAKKGSLITGDTARDMVVPVVYDDLGREQYKYLPFVANNTGSNNSISDGRFKLNPFQQDSAFHKGLFSDESYYYGQTVFEISPLSRPLESYAPGNNWVGTVAQFSEADRHGVKMKYWVNTVADSVRLWSVTDVPNTFGTYTTSSIYGAGMLLKNVSQDEHNKQVIEFTDKTGKVILKKVQLTANADTGTGKNHTGWLCTYYIYDDFNQLRAVIQPKGVEVLAGSNWSLTTTLLNEQCFRYEYDKKGGMIIKEVPGSGIVYMIYDKRNRVVMSQDSILRAAHKWSYIIYDGLNRPTTTGLITDNSYYNNPVYHRDHADTSIAWPNVASYTNEELTKTFYDDYSWRSGEGNPLSDTRNTSYDGYLLTTSDVSFPYPQSATSQSLHLRGLITGIKTKILGTSNYLYAVNFYDSKGKTIQVQGTNITGGTDISLMQYSWTGQVLLSVNKQEKAGTDSQTSVVLTKLTYDSLFRIIETEKKISNTKVNSGTMPGSWTIISEQEYDALGQLKKKKMGDTPLETLNYEYNIRGWMLGMNRSYIKDTTSTANWFGFDLSYDKTGFTVNGTSHSYTAAQYNGNIGGMMWRSNGDDYLRKYDFSYDAANRFLSADFNQLNSNSFSKAAGLNFSVTGMTYDANGNILTMNQKGWKLGGSVTIDSLLYGYFSNSNRLEYVTDRTNDSTSYLGDFKEYAAGASQDYSYDVNGNMTGDANKRITGITYNYLNLPQEITVQYNINPPYSTRSITYTYDATGLKLKKVVYENAGSGVNRLITTTYINGFVYESKITNQGGSPEPDDHTDVLQYIPTEEGRARIRKDSSAVVYDYMVKDHLGNVRMTLTNEKDTAFYPAATMETGNAGIENLYYSNIELSRYSKPSGYTDTSTNPNAYVARLYSQDKAYMLGPAIALRVMAGDKFNVRVSSWYSSSRPPDTNEDPLESLLAAVESSIGNITGTHGGPGAGEISASQVLFSAVNSFLNGQSYDDSKPKAYLNWILFDDRFNYINSCSGYEQVGDDGEFTIHAFNNLPITKNGYLYVYLSNASNDIEVFFDNLQITHIRGPLLQENHYYPFGLTMAGISSKALNFGNPENRKKFNGIEHTTEFDLNTYDAFFRNADPQIGRWWQIDPKPNVMESPYVMMGNNPIRNADPLGDTLRIASTSSRDFKTKAFNDIQKLSNRKLVLLKDGSVVLASQVKKGDKGLIDMTGTVTKGAKSYGTSLVKDLIKSDKSVNLKETTGGNFTKAHSMEAFVKFNHGQATLGAGSGSDISYNPNKTTGGVDVNGGTTRPAFIGLSHELLHAISNTLGGSDLSVFVGTLDPDSKKIDVITVDENFTRLRENKIRAEHGVPLRQIPMYYKID